MSARLEYKSQKRDSHAMTQAMIGAGWRSFMASWSRGASVLPATAELKVAVKESIVLGLERWGIELSL